MSGQPRDKAWAQRMVREHGGRPHRMLVWCLLLDLGEGDVRGFSHDEQREKLAPFVLEGEDIRFSSSLGEAFIVPRVTGGMGPGGVASSRSLESLQAEQSVKRSFSKALDRMQRSAFQEAYTHATADMVGKYVELEHLVLEKALDPDASPADRKMAMKAWESWKDRHMGKAVTPTEDVTVKSSDIRELMASAAPPALPASAEWTVESVAEEERRALEAGVLGGSDG